MFVQKKLKKSIIFFAVFVVCGVWDVEGSPKGKSDGVELPPEMMRYVSACRFALDKAKPGENGLVEAHEKFWKNEYWPDVSPGENQQSPVVESLVFDREKVRLFLGDDGVDKISGVMIAKGHKIVVALAGRAFWESGFWQTKNDESTKFGDGIAHKGTRTLSQAVLGDLLGDDGNFRGMSGLRRLPRKGKIREYMELFNSVSYRQLLPSDFQITVVGHSVGGAVAHFVAAEIVDKLLDGSNEGRSLHVVTMGATRVFDEEGARAWNEKVGAANHTRLVASRDTFLGHCSGKPFTTFTGVEQVLEQSEKVFKYTAGTLRRGKPYHTLECYEELVKMFSGPAIAEERAAVATGFAGSEKVGEKETFQQSLSVSPGGNGSFSD